MGLFLNCIKKHKVNYSESREIIYKVLDNSNDCLTVSQIRKTIKDYYKKNISLNTIYRHLTLFDACSMINIIQDDYKKSYYCLKKNRVMFFLVCTKCKRVIKLNENNFANCSEFEKINDLDFVTLHKRSERCYKTE